MPYIKEERKAALEQGLIDPKDLTAGDLNFLITNLLVLYVGTHERTYETLNAVVGALDNAKLEFVRRVVYPYETMKAAENGDAYAALFQRPRVEIATPQIEIANG